MPKANDHAFQQQQFSEKARNMMNFFEYKGFIIYPNPKLSLETNTWTINLSIRHNNKIKSFTSEHSFSTKGEAVFHCIGFGKKVIDGEMEAHSVTDIL
jgi:hypothetical protein